jgi:hypothetical protein
LKCGGGANVRFALAARYASLFLTGMVVVRMAVKVKGYKKQAVWKFWDEAACGEVYAVGSTLAEPFENHARS